MAAPDAKDYKKLIPKLMGELQSSHHPSGLKIAEILAVVIESYEARLTAHETRLALQQEEIDELKSGIAKNRENILGLVEATNSKVKENLMKINEKVKRMRQSTSSSRLDRSRTAGGGMRMSNRRPDMSDRSGSKEWAIKDSADSQATSRLDLETPTSSANPFRITRTDEDEEADNQVGESNQVGEVDEDVAFDIDGTPQGGASPEKDFGQAGSQPKPTTFGASQLDDDEQPKVTFTTGESKENGGAGMGVLPVATMMSTFSSDDDEEDEAFPPGSGKLTMVTTQMLDKGDMYRSNPSVWDTMFFIGIPAIGTTCSLLVLFIWMLNILLQIAFIYIVEEILQTPEVDASVLDGLLRFRLGAAHSADFADKVSMRSMAAQVCSGENKLHMAGNQQYLYGLFEKFDSDRAWLAEMLVMLIQFLWAATVMRDINNTYTIFRGVKNVLRSRKSTRLYLADLQDSDDEDETEKVKQEEVHEASAGARESNASNRASLFKTARTSLRALIEQDHEFQDEESHANLVSIMKVVRWTRIWYVRFYGIVMLVCIPKLILAIALYWVGAKWLAGTISLTELILNGVALAFVLDFDEVLFDIFVPRRCKILVGNLEPMPLSRGRKGNSYQSIINSMLKLGGSAFLLLGLYLWMSPTFWQLRQAQAIMCSGVQDFIYTVNPATGLIHVAKTSSDPEAWSETEYSIAQLAKPSLERNDAWEEFSNERMFQKVEAPLSLAVLPGAFTSLENAEMTDSDFKAIIQMNVWSLADAASALPCEDLAESLNRNGAMHELRKLVGRDDIQSCADVPLGKCSEASMSQLRALCPKHCKCEDPWGGFVGYYGTPEFGCPLQCSTFRAARNEIEYRFNLASADQGRFLIDCTEFAQEDFAFQGGCASSQTAFDAYNADCGFYAGYSVFRCDGRRDDVDFTAMDMCCECALFNFTNGSNATIQSYEGAATRKAPSSAECWAAFTDDCYLMPSKKLAWFLYVRGLFEHILSTPGFGDSIRKVVAEDYAGLKVEGKFPKGLDAEDIVSYITDGVDGMARTLAVEDTWEIAPGVPHPRGKTGCEFLASYEITALLNMDLCNTAEGTSIKFFCPDSCGCTKGSELSECPAACVLTDCTQSSCRHAHPWYTSTDYLGFGELVDSCSNTAAVGDTDKHGNACPVRDLTTSLFMKDNVTVVTYKDQSFCSEDNNIGNFSAIHQCCVCGGGTDYNPCHDSAERYARDANGNNCDNLLDIRNMGNVPDCTADDHDFTATDMCCVCEGGTETAEVKFRITLNGVDLDSLDATQQDEVKSAVQQNVLQFVRISVPECTADNVKVTLRQGSIKADVQVIFTNMEPDRFYGTIGTTGVSSMIRTDIASSNFGTNLTESVASAASITGLSMRVSSFTSGGMRPAPTGFLAQQQAEEAAAGPDPCDGDNPACGCSLAVDSRGKGCDYYSENYLYCQFGPTYDDFDFSAMSMCCVCEDIVIPTPAPTPAECSNSHEEGAVNAWGMTCDNVATNTNRYCGANYADDDFIPTEHCCACGGGISCQDSHAEGAKNAWGMGCEQIGFNPDRYCGYGYGDDDFMPWEHCCVCEGVCIDTHAVGAKNAWGMHCGNVATNTDRYCGANYADDDFIPWEHCCACGAGSNYQPPEQEPLPCDAVPLAESECPHDPHLLKTCGDASLIPGDLCESDGESCGTSQELNNCRGYFDVYRIVNSTATTTTGTTATATTATTTPHTITATTKSYTSNSETTDTTTPHTTTASSTSKTTASETTDSTTPHTTTASSTSETTASETTASETTDTTTPHTTTASSTTTTTASSTVSSVTKATK